MEERNGLSGILNLQPQYVGPFLPCSSFHAAVVVSRIIVTTSSPMILSNPPFISVWKETGALNYACSRELSDQISLYCLTSPTALVTSETFS
jgi:hypothetical protein